MDKLIPATAEHVQAIYGAPFKRTAIAITGESEGKPFGIGAIYPHEGCMIMVFCLTPEGRENVKRHAKAIVKGARYLLDKARRYNLPVQTTADDYPRSRELLEHLGFKPVTHIHYEWRP